jgi:hypothetical protein
LDDSENCKRYFASTTSMAFGIWIITRNVSTGKQDACPVFTVPGIEMHSLQDETSGLQWSWGHQKWFRRATPQYRGFLQLWPFGKESRFGH